MKLEEEGRDADMDRIMENQPTESAKEEKDQTEKVSQQQANA